MSIREALLQRVFRALYGPFAGLHELAGRAAFGPAWAARRSMVLERVHDGPLLDVGCGDGRLLRAAIDHDHAGVGIDRSIAMARRARSRGILCVCAAAEQLPLRGGYFRSVVVTYPGPWILSADVWREIARVLAPDGTVTVLIGGDVSGLGRRHPRRIATNLIYGRERLTNDRSDMPELGHGHVTGTYEIVPDRWGNVMLWTSGNAG